MPEVQMACQLFIEVARTFEQGLPYMGDSFEEWLFWHVPATAHFRSSRQGVAQVSVPMAGGLIVDVVLWQSLLEHPDFVVERADNCLGIECKSLEASQAFIATRTGIPCRTTIDFNSTVPCGQENFKGKFLKYRNLRGTPIRVFYAFALYGEIDGENRIVSLLVADGNYLNRDYGLHQEHRNISRSGFGSYGDGQIRERKMYLFPNPLTDQDLKGTVSLVAEEPDLSHRFPQLHRIMTKSKMTPDGQEFPFYVYRVVGRDVSNRAFVGR